MSGWGTGYNWPTEKTVELIQQKIDNTWPDVLNVLEQAKKDIEAVTGIADIPKFLNKKPTHDPYTNPNAHIYYQCDCGAVLDPGTKSFAELNNCASKADWKIRWGADSYVPYCVKCGEDVE